MAVESAGRALVRNSLIFNNASGLVSSTGGGIDSRYNDLFNNQVNYTGVAVGVGDLSEAVAFRDAAADDFRLERAQGSTDRGDPSDPYDREPSPNGGRVNLGAFGNTAEAEHSDDRSRPATADAGGDALGEDGQVARTRPGGCGCAVGATQGRSTGAFAALLMFALLLHRRRRP